jgi:uncharacterized protein (TIGR02594 family)
MRFKFRIMLAGGCASLLALSLPAISRPAPRGIETDRRLPIHVQLPLPRPKQIARRVEPAPVERLPAERLQAERPPVERVSLAAMSRQALGWSLVNEARKYIGTNPTDRSRLWCATFMNFVLAKVGYAGTNSDAAKSFADYGRRISEPQVGAIAVLTRGRRGGHVGVVSGIDANGNPVIISGNHNKTVGEGVYPRSRVIAYVMPTGARPVTTEMAARSNFSRVASEQGFESPIAELLAAIEAEQARPGRNRPPAQPAADQRVSVRAGSQGLDPKLAEFLGLDRAPAGQMAQRSSRVIER